MNLYTKSRDGVLYEANADYTAGVVIVKKGSKINRQLSNAVKSRKAIAELIADDSLFENQNYLKNDIRFTSLSTAATFVTGRIANGNIVWKTEDGKYVCELATSSSTPDAFGHIQMTGTAAYLANVIKNELGCKTRAVELSTLQRAAAHLASKIDVDEAFNVGGANVKAADEGSSGVMVVINRVSDDPYQSATAVYDVHRIANDEKVVPRDWITKAGNYVTEEFLDYVRPLIQGQYSPMMVEGLPRHLTMHLKNYDWRAAKK